MFSEVMFSATIFGARVWKILYRAGSDVDGIPGDKDRIEDGSKDD